MASMTLLEALQRLEDERDKELPCMATMMPIEILRYIQNHGPTTVIAIARMLGLSQDEVRSAIAHLDAIGLILHGADTDVCQRGALDLQFWPPSTGAAVDKVQILFYLLMRDALPSSTLVSAVSQAIQAKASVCFTAAGIAEYARELAERLLKGTSQEG